MANFQISSTLARYATSAVAKGERISIPMKELAKTEMWKRKEKQREDLLRAPSSYINSKTLIGSGISVMAGGVATTSKDSVVKILSGVVSLISGGYVLKTAYDVYSGKKYLNSINERNKLADERKKDELINRSIDPLIGRQPISSEMPEILKNTAAATPGFSRLQGANIPGKPLPPSPSSTFNIVSSSTPEPAYTDVVPLDGNLFITDEKIIPIQWKDPQKLEDQWGGIDLYFDIKDFWKTVIRYRPLRRLQMLKYPVVERIDESMVNGRKINKNYRINRHYLSSGTSVDRHLISGAYINPRLTHYFRPKVAYEYFPEYHSRKVHSLPRAIPSWDDFTFPYAPGAFNVFARFVKEIYYEHPNDWVVFCRGTQDENIGDVDRDSLHSYYVTCYGVLQQRLFYDGIDLMNEFRGTTAGKIWMAGAQMCISMASVFVGGMLTSAIKSIGLVLENLIQRVSGRLKTRLVNRIQIFIASMEVYYKFIFRDNPVPEDISNILNQSKKVINYASEVIDVDPAKFLEGFTPAKQDELLSYAKCSGSLTKIVAYKPTG